MIELHLIGYTEDAEELVFDLDADGEGRYVLAIDPDLLATLEQLRGERVARGAPVDRRDTSERPSRAVAAPLVARRPSVPPAAHTPPPETGPGRHGTDELAPVDDDDPTIAVDDDPTAPAAPDARLSPAEIQRRLRAGRSVRAVADAAGVDAAWIERWLAPILAERERVLAEARARPATASSHDTFGAVVARAIDDRGVVLDRVSWTAARRADGRWRISVRFPEDGRSRSATWLLADGVTPPSPTSTLATSLSNPSRSRPRARPR